MIIAIIAISLLCNIKVTSWPQLISQSFWSHIPICNAASDWPRTFFIPKVFLFSMSLLFWKYKHMLLLASSREVLHGHNLYLPSTQYCKLNFEA